MSASSERNLASDQRAQYEQVLAAMREELADVKARNEALAARVEVLTKALAEAWDDIRGGRTDQTNPGG